MNENSFEESELSNNKRPTRQKANVACPLLSTCALCVVVCVQIHNNFIILV